MLCLSMDLKQSVGQELYSTLIKMCSFHYLNEAKRFPEIQRVLPSCQNYSDVLDFPCTQESMSSGDSYCLSETESQIKKELHLIHIMTNFLYELIGLKISTLSELHPS